MTFAFAHRGVRIGDEENTLIAFQRAWDLGVRHLESDLHASADGTVFLFHDDTLDRVTNTSGKLGDYTDEQLASVRAGGQPLCTLDEVLDTFPEAIFNLDVKDDDVIGPLAELIERRGAHNQIAIAAFESSRTHAVQHLLSSPIRRSPGRSDIAVMWLFAHVTGRVPKKLLKDYWAVQIPFKLHGLPVATERFTKAIQRAGAQVHVWTVNDEPTMKLLVDRKVDAIISDEAALLMKVLGS